jgi:hypothetical protein
LSGTTKSERVAERVSRPERKEWTAFQSAASFSLGEFSASIWTRRQRSSLLSSVRSRRIRLSHSIALLQRQNRAIVQQGVEQRRFEGSLSFQWIVKAAQLDFLRLLLDSAKPCLPMVRYASRIAASSFSLMPNLYFFHTAGVPIKLLHEGEGHVITVELKNGEIYKGMLAEAEDTMNCQMKEGKALRSSLQMGAFF